MLCDQIIQLWMLNKLVVFILHTEDSYYIYKHYVIHMHNVQFIIQLVMCTDNIESLLSTFHQILCCYTFRSTLYSYEMSFFHDGL